MRQIDRIKKENKLNLHHIWIEEKEVPEEKLENMIEGAYKNQDLTSILWTDNPERMINQELIDKYNNDPKKNYKLKLEKEPENYKLYFKHKDSFDFKVIEIVNILPVLDEFEVKLQEEKNLALVNAQQTIQMLRKLYDSDQKLFKNPEGTPEFQQILRSSLAIHFPESCIDLYEKPIGDINHLLNKLELETYFAEFSTDPHKKPTDDTNHSLDKSAIKISDLQITQEIKNLYEHEKYTAFGEILRIFLLKHFPGFYINSNTKPVIGLKQKFATGPKHPEFQLASDNNDVIAYIPDKTGKLEKKKIDLNELINHALKNHSQKEENRIASGDLIRSILKDHYQEETERQINRIKKEGQYNLHYIWMGKALPEERLAKIIEGTYKNQDLISVLWTDNLEGVIDQEFITRYNEQSPNQKIELITEHRNYKLRISKKNSTSFFDKTTRTIEILDIKTILNELEVKIKIEIKKAETSEAKISKIRELQIIQTIKDLYEYERKSFRTPSGYAALSDILRIFLLKYFPGFYIDSDANPVMNFKQKFAIGPNHPEFQLASDNNDVMAYIPDKTGKKPEKKQIELYNMLHTLFEEGYKNSYLNPISYPQFLVPTTPVRVMSTTGPVIIRKILYKLEQPEKYTEIEGNNARQIREGASMHSIRTMLTIMGDLAEIPSFINKKYASEIICANDWIGVPNLINFQIEDLIDAIKLDIKYTQSLRLEEYYALLMLKIQQLGIKPEQEKTMKERFFAEVDQLINQALEESPTLNHIKHIQLSFAYQETTNFLAELCAKTGKAEFKAKVGHELEYNYLVRHEIFSLIHDIYQKTKVFIQKNSNYLEVESKSIGKPIGPKVCSIWDFIGNLKKFVEQVKIEEINQLMYATGFDASLKKTQLEILAKLRTIELKSIPSKILAKLGITTKKVELNTLVDVEEAKTKLPTESEALVKIEAKMLEFKESILKEITNIEQKIQTLEKLITSADNNYKIHKNKFFASENNEPFIFDVKSFEQELSTIAKPSIAQPSLNPNPLINSNTQQLEVEQQKEAEIKLNNLDEQEIVMKTTLPSLKK